MKLDSKCIVVIGFPHNQKCGGLDPETKRSLDGLKLLYADHAAQKRLALLYISGQSRPGMQPKNYSMDKFMNGTMEKSKYINIYDNYDLGSEPPKCGVGVILLIHATAGFPKIFEAQTSTQYIKKDNASNGRIIARLLKTLALSGCIDKLQLVACKGAKCEGSISLLQGIADGIIDEGFENPPLVIGWDVEVTHNADGSMSVASSNDPKVESEHRQTLVPPPAYDPAATDRYETVLLWSPSGYQPAHNVNWSGRQAMKTSKRCVLL
ncbi:MAG TPA: hypothetical protein VMB34_22390 [Acetobacteraceae bacterium]|nr:hypothetical protein [Acetobacteraceae bacterium]